MEDKIFTIYNILLIYVVNLLVWIITVILGPTGGGTAFLPQVKVNQSRYRPGVAQTAPYFMATVQGGGKVESLKPRPPFLPGNAPGTHFC